jgi:hypothetical protein
MPDADSTTIGKRLAGDAFRCLDVAHVGDAARAPGVGLGLEVRAQLLVVALGMREIDAGGVDRERAVDVDRDVGQAALRAQRVEREHHLLGAADREGGDDHLAAARGGAADHLGQPIGRSARADRGRSRRRSTR